MKRIEAVSRRCFGGVMRRYDLSEGRYGAVIRCYDGPNRRFLRFARPIEGIQLPFARQEGRLRYALGMVWVCLGFTLCLLPVYSACTPGMFRGGLCLLCACFLSALCVRCVCDLACSRACSRVAPRLQLTSLWVCESVCFSARSVCPTSWFDAHCCSINYLALRLVMLL